MSAVMKTLETCVKEIRSRLVAEGAYVFTRGWQNDPPNFRGIADACEQLFKSFPRIQSVLTKRHANLRVLREMCLGRGIKVIVPAKAGTDVFRIPPSALYHADGTRRHKALALSKSMWCAQPCTDPVDLVVTGCLGFTPGERRLYLLGDDACAGRIEEWRTRWTEQLEGVPNGCFALAPDVPVVAIASDLQEVIGWPRCMHSFVEADLVITPTRVLDLESLQICAL